MTRFFDWLGSRLPGLSPGQVPPAEPAAMTDAQLREAIFKVSVQLIDHTIGPWLMQSFDGRPMNDERFPWAMPTSLRMQVQLGFASAHDSACLTAIALQWSASASALGPMRNVAETFVRLSWLLDAGDDRLRLSRVYGLMQDAIDQESQLVATLQRSAHRMSRTLDPWVARFTAATERKRGMLAGIAAQDGVDIERLPATADLFEQYLGDEGGYVLFSLLSSAGVHPGSSRSFMFYGSATSSRVDFDFQGMHGLRAYWLSRSVRLHIALCRLAAPELDWPPDWPHVLGELQKQLDPLAAEAERRCLTPLTDFLETLTTDGTTGTVTSE